MDQPQKPLSLVQCCFNTLLQNPKQCSIVRKNKDLIPYELLQSLSYQALCICKAITFAHHTSNNEFDDPYGRTELLNTKMKEISVILSHYDDSSNETLPTHIIRRNDEKIIYKFDVNNIKLFIEMFQNRAACDFFSQFYDFFCNNSTSPYGDTPYIPAALTSFPYLTEIDQLYLFKILAFCDQKQKKSIPYEYASHVMKTSQKIKKKILKYAEFLSKQPALQIMVMPLLQRQAQEHSLVLEKTDSYGISYTMPSPDSRAAEYNATLQQLYTMRPFEYFPLSKEMTCIKLLLLLNLIHTFNDGKYFPFYDRGLPNFYSTHKKIYEMQGCHPIDQTLTDCPTDNGLMKCSYKFKENGTLRPWSMKFLYKKNYKTYKFMTVSYRKPFKGIKKVLDDTTGYYSLIINQIYDHMRKNFSMLAQSISEKNHEIEEFIAFIIKKIPDKHLSYLLIQTERNKIQKPPYSLPCFDENLDRSQIINLFKKLRTLYEEYENSKDEQQFKRRDNKLIEYIDAFLEASKTKITCDGTNEQNYNALIINFKQMNTTNPHNAIQKIEEIIKRNELFNKWFSYGLMLRTVATKKYVQEFRHEKFYLTNQEM